MSKYQANSVQMDLGTHKRGSRTVKDQLINVSCEKTLSPPWLFSDHSPHGKLNRPPSSGEKEFSKRLNRFGALVCSVAGCRLLLFREFSVVYRVRSLERKEDGGGSGGCDGGDGQEARFESFERGGQQERNLNGSGVGGDERGPLTSNSCRKSAGLRTRRWKSFGFYTTVEKSVKRAA
ncbi:hypothetical protein GWI33_001750 [Rhynchophorus ferrugineus]|uniref:Uncharacterized protein n=1 Tax=Rhynchophorus ferrugineus TaxID=354439 RepID=A0A834IRV5_RHYFE|nr:hypothetical protein GWI33_001750 [Rhynchophorus ferrugineus]